MHKMHKKHLKIFYKLIDVAKKSPMKNKHAAAIVSRNKTIISTGFNYLTKKKGYYSIHAERSALLNCDLSKLKGSTLYVMRLGKKNNFKLSAPCKMCKSLINSFIIKYKLNKKIYYTL